MGLKLDMNKAYDRIEWDFVKEVSLKLGFDRTWVRQVMGWIISIRFIMLLNGKSGSSFKPSRGLKQGYLFLHVERGIVQGIKFSGDGPTLSHLFFADDSIMFLKATKQNCTTVESILTSYCRRCSCKVVVPKDCLTNL
ncbi:hypothetical protein PRUPE_6G105300 [Prunus persica]|uniref:Uncharacterized protein n=1 Tax=Prunus persica TaxID=3760 RepID=M5W220_PRUPE|nr:hypothetical protein PRUPE_6G105300 [Prunus persica]